MEFPDELLSAGYTFSELIYGCPIDVMVLCVNRMRKKQRVHSMMWTYRIRMSIIQFLELPSFKNLKSWS